MRFENLYRTKTGQVNGLLYSDKYPDGQDYTLDEVLTKRAEDGEWGDIKDIPKSEVTAHKKEQAQAAIMRKLSGLDLPTHTLAMAISGDSVALDKVAKAELLKVALREELNAIK